MLGTGVGGNGFQVIISDDGEILTDLELLSKWKKVKINLVNKLGCPQKPTATMFCINIHSSTKYAICMHKANKTLEKGYKYTRPTFYYTHPFKRTSAILEIIE